MSSSENGIRQSPFADVWSTPNVGGTGVNGIGGGLDQGSGGNGLVGVPWTGAVVPTPGGEGTPCQELGGNPPAFSSVEGGDAPGSQAPWDITTSRNTVDRK